MIVAILLLCLALLWTACASYELHKSHLNRIAAKLDRVLAALGALQTEVHSMDATLDDILSEATDEGSKVDSILTLVTKLAAEQDPAKRNAIVAQLRANKQKLIDAINANTPGEPIPVEPPPA